MMGGRIKPYGPAGQFKTTIDHPAYIELLERKGSAGPLGDQDLGELCDIASARLSKPVTRRVGELIFSLLRAYDGLLLEGGNQSKPLIRHHGHLRSFPPYVGGDDDEIDGWQAECACGFRGRETEYVSVANGELVKHLNEALTHA